MLFAASRAFDTRAAKNVKKVVRRLTYSVWQPRGTVNGPGTPTGTTNGPRGQRRQPPTGATCVLCVHLNLRHREGVKARTVSAEIVLFVVLSGENRAESVSSGFKRFALPTGPPRARLPCRSTSSVAVARAGQRGRPRAQAVAR